MNAHMKALYELQFTDLKISDINKQLAAMDGARDLRKRYSLAKAIKEKAEKAVFELEVELKDNELRLKTIDEKRSSMEKRLYAGSISNPKELAAVEREIKSLVEQQSQLDPRVLELYDAVDAAKAKAADAGKVLEDAERVARAAIKKEKAERVRLEAELAELSSVRATEVEEINDRAILSRYDAIRKKTGNSGVVMVVDGKCEGCHVSITSYIISNLYSNDEVQYCENCGRMLALDV